MTTEPELTSSDVIFITKGVEKILNDTGWGCLDITLKEGLIAMAEAAIKMNPRKTVTAFQYTHLIPPTVEQLKQSVLDVMKATGWGNVKVDFINGEAVLIHVHQVRKPQPVKPQGEGVNDEASLPFSE